MWVPLAKASPKSSSTPTTLRGAARKAAKHVDEATEAAANRGRRGLHHADNVGNGVASAATKAIPEEASTLKKILNKVANFFIHNDVTKSLGIHDELTAFANKLGLKACFAAGTPLLTPDGSKPIEEFKVGDLVLSRSEFDPNGPIEAKVVEELFRRTAPILHVHVSGQVIRTTGEHPFYVEGKGWIPAHAMVAGDRLLSHDGQTVEVEEVFDTGEWETVYNMRVADWHTYFVGSAEWGFSVWSHNTIYEVIHKGMRLIKKDEYVSRVLEAIKDAVTQAKKYVDDLTAQSPLTGHGRIDLYINLLRARAGTPLNELPESTRNIVRKFTIDGVTDWNKMLPMFKGYALQTRANNILRGVDDIAELITDGRLLLDVGSELGIRSESSRRLLKPDFQLRLPDNRWSIFDLTTEKEIGKILRKYNHHRSPYLIEIIY